MSTFRKFNLIGKIIENDKTHRNVLTQWTEQYNKKTNYKSCLKALFVEYNLFKRAPVFIQKS